MITRQKCLRSNCLKLGVNKSFVTTIQREFTLYFTTAVFIYTEAANIPQKSMWILDGVFRHFIIRWEFHFKLSLYPRVTSQKEHKKKEITLCCRFVSGKIGSLQVSMKCFSVGRRKDYLYFSQIKGKAFWKDQYVAVSFRFSEMSCITFFKVLKLLRWKETGPGARFSKVPVTFRARNQIFKSKYKE